MLTQRTQVEEILFHLIDLDVLLAPSGKEADAAKKVALREALAKGPLLSWFGGIEARPSDARALRCFGSADARSTDCAAQPVQEQERLAGR